MCLLFGPRLPYTEAVLMEIQRLANVPPLGIAHRALCNTKLFDFIIPQGTTILTSLFSMHMNNDYWKNPTVFDPERFLTDNGKINIHEKHFLPFGFGNV